MKRGPRGISLVMKKERCLVSMAPFENVGPNTAVILIYFRFSIILIIIHLGYCFLFLDFEIIMISPALLTKTSKKHEIGLQNYQIGLKMVYFGFLLLVF